MSATSIPKPESVTALYARTQLGSILKRARSGKARFVVGRRGEPQVVIMGIADFLRNVAPEPRILASLRKAARRAGRDRITMREIDREIRAYRKSRARRA